MGPATSEIATSLMFQDSVRMQSHCEEVWPQPRKSECQLMAVSGTTAFKTEAMEPAVRSASESSMVENGGAG
jgi:hypothetical protein